MSELKICPKCGKVAGFNSWFQAFYCTSCGHLWDRIHRNKILRGNNMENSKELAACACCGKLVEQGEMYFQKGFFDTYEIVDGQYVYSGYMVCEDCHNNGK